MYSAPLAVSVGCLFLSVLSLMVQFLKPHRMKWSAILMGVSLTGVVIVCAEALITSHLAR
jgi:hypothetical protein